MKFTKAIFAFGLVLGVTSFANAKTVEVAFELPSFTSENYRNPYVAIWLEGQEDAQTLMLWHLKKKQEDKWLIDIKRWWRKVGRYGETPDAYTGATQGPGRYSKTFTIPDNTDYTLLLEVVREDGGRSLVKQKLDTNQTYTLGDHAEVTGVTITVGE